MPLRSLRLRLLTQYLLTVGLLVAAAMGALYVLVRWSGERELDPTLRAEVHKLAAAVEVNPKLQAHLDGKKSLEKVAPAQYHVHWQVLLASGATLLRSRSPAGGVDLPAVGSHELPLDEGSWDEKRRVADGNALHHEEIEPTSLEEPRPADPNAAWLADLYAQFIDDPEIGGAGTGKKKKGRGDTQALDVAFKAEEVDGEARVSTLKRLMGALKKI